MHISYYFSLKKIQTFSIAMVEIKQEPKSYRDEHGKCLCKFHEINAHNRSFDLLVFFSVFCIDCLDVDLTLKWFYFFLSEMHTHWRCGRLKTILHFICCIKDIWIRIRKIKSATWTYKFSGWTGLYWDEFCIIGGFDTEINIFNHIKTNYNL